MALGTRATGRFPSALEGDKRRHFVTDAGIVTDRLLLKQTRQRYQAERKVPELNPKAGITPLAMSSRKKIGMRHLNKVYCGESCLQTVFCMVYELCGPGIRDHHKKTKYVRTNTSSPSSKLSLSGRYNLILHRSNFLRQHKTKHRSPCHSTSLSTSTKNLRGHHHSKPKKPP